MKYERGEKVFDIGEVVNHDGKLCTVINKGNEGINKGCIYDYYLLGEDGLRYGFVSHKHMEETDKNQNFSCQTRKKLFLAVMDADKKYRESKGTGEKIKESFETYRYNQKKYNNLLSKCKLYECQETTKKI